MTNNYNGNTKEFLLKLALLFEEYQVEMNVGAGRDGYPKGVELTVPNPISFEVFDDQWMIEHPGEYYPQSIFDPRNTYQSVDSVDIGNWNDAKSLREYLK